MNTPSSESASSQNASRPCTIRYVGVGGAGAKFIALLATAGFPSESLVVLGSDEAQLRSIEAPRKLLLQSRLLRGIGTSGDPDIGRAAADELTPIIKPVCEGVDVVILIAGLGGGTGTGAAPVVARLAHEAGALVLVFAVMPFDCEGRRKSAQATAGLEELKSVADGVLCLANQKLFKNVGGGRTLLDAFKTGTDHLLGGVQSLQRLLTRRGLIDIKFSTLCAALRGRHAESAFATVLTAGPDRVQAAVDCIMSHPMLDEGQALAAADAVLVSLTGGPDLGMDEVDRLMQQMQESCGEAEVLFGADIDETYKGQVSLTVIATQRCPANTGPSNDEGVTGAASRLSEGSFDGTMGTTFLDAQEPVRSASRLVPPPPEMTEEKRWEVLEKRSKRGGRRSGPKLKQGQLPLQILSKGRFDKTEPTLHNGEDLDMPTYLRRGVALN